MTDERVCTLRYQPNSRIHFRENAVIIDFTGAGGVDTYRYRVDKKPANPLRLGSEWGRDFIEIQDWENELSEGTTLRVDGLTFIPQRVYAIDIDLRGLKAAKDAMSRECAPAN